MQAVVRDRYGPPDVLELREVEQPELPDDGVLVRVHAASVNRVDWVTTSSAGGAGTVDRSPSTSAHGRV